MFDVSFSELLLILVVGLLVFGPEKLPEVIRSVTRGIAKFRNGFNQIRTDIEREVGIDELKRDLHNQSIIDTFKDVQGDLRGAQQELERLPYDVSDVVKRNQPVIAPADNPEPASASPTTTATKDNSPPT
jgi:sec-independent protein translocase protein TatB